MNRKILLEVNRISELMGVDNHVISESAFPISKFLKEFLQRLSGKALSQGVKKLITNIAETVLRRIGTETKNFTTKLPSGKARQILNDIKAQPEWKIEFDKLPDLEKGQVDSQIMNQIVEMSDEAIEYSRNLPAPSPGPKGGIVNRKGGQVVPDGGKVPKQEPDVDLGYDYEIIDDGVKAAKDQAAKESIDDAITILDKPKGKRFFDSLGKLPTNVIDGIKYMKDYVKRTIWIFGGTAIGVGLIAWFINNYGEDQLTPEIVEEFQDLESALESDNGTGAGGTGAGGTGAGGTGAGGTGAGGTGADAEVEYGGSESLYTPYDPAEIRKKY